MIFTTISMHREQKIAMINLVFIIVLFGKILFDPQNHNIFTFSRIKVFHLHRQIDPI